MISLEDLYLAYFDCRKNKRNTQAALMFEVNYESNLIQLQADINDRTYRPSQSITFIAMVPRPREIFAANFRDRVLHHFIDLKIRPLMEEILVDTTCNNRIGKGTEGCVRYVERFIRDCSNNYTKDCWVCSVDMKGFFMSISKSILLRNITHFVRSNYKGSDVEVVCWILEILLKNNPADNCVRRSPIEMWDLLDKSKSLFGVDPDLGLAIGDLVSQLMANFFLNDFDHFVSESYPFYTRYVDDCVIVSNDKNKLLEFIPLMRKELLKVGVTLHPDKFYFQHYTKGIAIVGSVVKPGRIYLHNRTVNNAFRAVARINRMDVCLVNVERYRSVMNSYLGFMSGRSSFNLRKKLVLSMSEGWSQYFYSENTFNRIILKNKYKCNKKRLTKNDLRF